MIEKTEINDIYLDNASTTRPFDEVITFMGDIYKYHYANPSSLHRKGLEAEKLISEARRKIAETIGVSSTQLVLTSGGTESNNLAIQGYLSANKRTGNHILCSPIEHPSVLEVVRRLQDSGYEVEYLSVNNEGEINLDSLSKTLRKSTCLVIIMLVNNETGAVQPIGKAAEIIRRSGAPASLHVDAVQGFGKIPFNPQHDGVGTASLSAHKIHGPKGAGAIFVRDGVKIKPIVFGGGQEGTLRSGTENVAGIAGFGLAAEMVSDKMKENYDRIAALKEIFSRSLKSEIGGVVINSNANSSPYILNVSFENTKGQILHNSLEQRGVFVSTGAACSSRKKQKSYVLEAAGVDKELIDGTLRFSFGLFNSEDDITVAVRILKTIVPSIRKNF